MAEQTPMSDQPEQGGASVAPAKPERRPTPKNRPAKPLPPWKVLLHNDDVNTMDAVVRTVHELTPLNKHAAELCVLEADKTGVALVLVAHRERAELYQEQFTSCGLTVTIEPDA